MRFAIILALFFVQFNGHVIAEGYYTIVSPGTIHPNSRYNVAISVQQTTLPSKIRIGIDGPEFEKAFEVDVRPMIVKNVEFLIPQIQRGTYTLTAEGLSGLIFKNSTILNYADNEPSIYVQTDKATYKPGDLVRFRIIFLDENLRPAKIDKPVSVFIKDDANTRIAQFSNVTITKGVFTEKLQLSDFTVLGKWEIEVLHDGKQVYRKEFKVAKYVLPKVEVTIDAPQKISLEDENFGFTVQAKYTFGKPVKGKALITVKSFKFLKSAMGMPGGAYNPGVNNYYPIQAPYVPPQGISWAPGSAALPQSVPIMPIGSAPQNFYPNNEQGVNQILTFQPNVPRNIIPATSYPQAPQNPNQNIWQGSQVSVSPNYQDVALQQQPLNWQYPQSAPQQAANQYYANLPATNPGITVYPNQNNVQQIPNQNQVMQQQPLNGQFQGSTLQGTPNYYLTGSVPEQNTYPNQNTAQQLPNQVFQPNNNPNLVAQIPQQQTTNQIYQNFEGSVPGANVYSNQNNFQQIPNQVFEANNQNQLPQQQYQQIQSPQASYPYYQNSQNTATEATIGANQNYFQQVPNQIFQTYNQNQVPQPQYQQFPLPQATNPYYQNLPTSVPVSNDYTNPINTQQTTNQVFQPINQNHWPQQQYQQNPLPQTINQNYQNVPRTANEPILDPNQYYSQQMQNQIVQPNTQNQFPQSQQVFWPNQQPTTYQTPNQNYQNMLQNVPTSNMYPNQYNAQQVPNQVYQNQPELQQNWQYQKVQFANPQFIPQQSQFIPNTNPNLIQPSTIPQNMPYVATNYFSNADNRLGVPFYAPQPNLQGIPHSIYKRATLYTAAQKPTTSRPENFHINYGHRIPHILEKTVEFQGKAYIEYKMLDLLPDGISSDFLYGDRSNNIEITVVLEEELTGEKFNATTEIQAKLDKIYVTPDSKYVECEHFEETFTYTAKVQDIFGKPVSDEREPVIFKFTENLSNVQKNLPQKTAYLNENGVAEIELDCHTYNTTGVSVEYRGREASGFIMARKSRQFFGSYTHGCEIRFISPERKTLADNIDFEVFSNDGMKNFVYSIIGRGNILTTEFVSISDDGVKKRSFTIKPTFEMMPEAKIFIYYLHNGQFRYCDTSFQISNSFKNSISINAPPQTSPGGKVNLKIKTDTNSYVGLMGVDQSVLLLKSGNDFKEDEIFNNIKNYKTSVPEHYNSIWNSYPGLNTGIITMTNAHYPYERHFTGIPVGASFPQVAVGSAMAGAAAPPGSSTPQPLTPPPRVRKEFLETWFFEDIPNFDQTNIVLQKQIPDTITSWVVTGFSLNEDTGLALTKYPTMIKTFRQFFISTNLPYSIKRGEKLEIPVVIFNYMEESLAVSVTLENEDDEFEFLEHTKYPTKCTKKLSVDANNGKTATFTIRAKKIGQINLKIIAIAPLAGDAINKKFRVEPEGITIYKNQDYYVHASQPDVEFSKKVSLDIPEDIVADSAHIEVTVMGDILSSTITNIDKLVRLPAGCGEQNMVNFVPNILVLRYLQSLNQAIPEVELKAKDFLKIGYQRELTYRHDDGSFSAFGKSDNSGSTWLTAYVMRSFHQAALYIDIDPKVLNQGLNFLASIQETNGRFPEVGKVLDFSHYNDIGLTAFVLLAFLENTEHINEYQQTISRGFQYLEQNVQNTNDLYALSIAVYALKLHNSAIVPALLQKLDAQAKIDGGHKWWTKEVADTRTDQAWRPKSHDVEITGYILMTLLEQNDIALPITKWLISQRNSNGGFSSTQETVVGLQALINFAQKSISTDTNVLINVSNGSYMNGNAKQFVVNPNNMRVLQTLELQNNTRDISFAVSGQGSAIFQISYRYNVKKRPADAGFSLDIQNELNKLTRILSLSVKAQFGESRDCDVYDSNMAVLEINLPSGYAARKSSFERLKAVEGVKRIDTEKDDTAVIVYLDSFKCHEIRLMPIEAESVYAVEDQKPAAIIIYDYYDDQKRATEFYKIDI